MRILAGGRMRGSAASHSTPLTDAVAGAFGLAPVTVELVKGIGFVVVTAAVLYSAMRQ